MSGEEDRLWRSPRVVPDLAYEDVPQALNWLTTAFGFRERSDARLTGKGFMLTWMEIGDGLITLSSAGGQGLQSPRTVGNATQSVKVYVDDVSATIITPAPRALK